MGSDTTISLRLATATDIPALHRLIENSVRGLQGGEYTERQIDGALGHTLGLDTQLIADGTYFVAETGGMLVASGGWSFRKTLFGSDGGPGRAAELLDPASDTAKIRAIFVHPAWARRGLGSRILEHCEHAARAAGFVRVEMGSTLTGVPLYGLKGYRWVSQVDVPLPNGEVYPVIRMEKTI